MAPDVDPYLTLGVPSGASLNEIKSAYRRLAKQYHPDTAGERALPRFLAIQAAYERLVDAEGRLRGQGGDPWRGRSAASGGARPRASRDAWRARRTSSSTGASTTSSAGTGAAGGAGGAARTRGAGGQARPPGTAGGSTTGAGRPGAGAARPDGERTRHRRGPRKATPGSTTYDEAAEVGRDPEWDGGAWYGPSMGTYWTINPREYADPRKHGPEYLARARRATGPGDPSGGPSHGGDRPRGSAAAASGATADPAEPATDADADAADGDWAWSGRAQTTTGGDAAGWAARSWTYDTRDPGPTWTQGREGRATGTAPRSPWPAATDAPPLPDLEALLRRLSPGSLLDLARRRRRWRLVLALVAWPPIGYLLSTLVLDSTGCSSYTAACPEEIRVPLVLAQLLLVLVLFAVPTLTAVAGFGSLVAFAVALPVAAILSPGVGPRAPVTSMILDVAFVAAYVAGLAFAAWRLSRRSTAPDPATPPGP